MAGSLAELDFCYLTTTGRISGNPHRIEIWFVLADETVFLMAGDRDRSDWVRNLMITPEVQLEVGGRKRVTRARVVGEASQEDALARRLMLEKYAERDGGDLGTWGRTALAVAVDWPASTSYTSLI
ncbi:MAG: nitroreductase family deazaflavin-dependent oxidoreductase [Actinobacteria bacterium]|nr:nitroreductase family deazaflavin-dependent oxidoreductase [Actinomycetota bacterium]MDQ3210047.1 nitroreductase family deazaflavin-dependent oxidoreductase [Actinomycetota bacterium]